MQVVFGLIAVVFGLLVAAILLTLVLVPLCRAIGWVIRHIAAFIGGEIRDVLRVFGALITGVVFSFLVVGNVLIFRWSAAAHFGRAFSAEVAALGSSVYRIIIGHPARLLGLNSLVDGIENRVPQALAAAPARDKPSKRTGLFEHYRIIGSLPGGGSGGKLYIAEPDDIKLAAFGRNGHGDAEQVVIKAFSLQDGSSLPQIVRESRALDAAKKLGLVLDHELTPERFYYVMRYVPGESLGVITQRLHAASPTDGLNNANLRRALGYMEHLLATLRRYHEGGLWHKDVKPDNIIIHGEGAHLVDFGLITPLRSAMTLTTHGTEYFRDPEMVRMALRGVKVHEVDGARFDVYAAGAVLYSVIENSFPAHGGLSQVTKRCPDAVRWIVRRAMTDYDKRYATASAMLEDLRHVAEAADPYQVKPAELPSVRGGEKVPEEPVVEVRSDEFEFIPPKPEPVAAAAPRRTPKVPGSGPRPAAATVAAAVAPRVRPKLRVTNWWSGQYRLADGAVPALAPLAPIAPRTAAGRPRRGGAHRSAAEQIESARARVAERRAGARARMHRHRNARAGRHHASGINLGVAASLFVFLAFCVGVAGLVISMGLEEQRSVTTVSGGGAASVQSGVARASVAVLDSAPALEEPPLPPLPPLRGQVLVVDDLSRPLDARVAAWMRGAIAAMEQGGLDVLSTLRDETEDTADVTTLVAEAKSARAMQPLDSEGAQLAITGWLAAQDRADILVWIDPPPAGQGAPAIHVFGSPEALEDAPEDVLPRIKGLFASWG